MSHHAHAGDRLVMAVAGAVVVTVAVVFWAGLARLFGGSL